VRGRIRSPRLLALSVALLAASGGLAYVLQHDAVGVADIPALAQAEAGDEVTVKGPAQPFVPRASSAREAAAWVDVERRLENATALVDTGEPDLVVLVTGLAAPPRPGSVLVATGPVVLHGPHPDGSARSLVVVRATEAGSPILFR
jgi:hypothetical protein